MITDAPPNKLRKLDVSSEPTIKTTYLKKVINPNKKYEMELDVDNLKRYYMRRMKPRVLKFKRKEGIWDDEALRIMAKAIKSMRGTQKLELKAGDDPCEMTNKGLHFLSEGIRKLGSLRSLRINFGWLEDGWIKTGAELQTLSKGLKNLTGLRNMNLSLEWYNEITEEELHKFGRVLRMLTSLQNLRIKLDAYNKIDNTRLEKLGEHLKNLVSLKKLNLILNGAELITDEGLEKFGEDLKKLVSLEIIVLDFANNSSGTGSYFEGFEDNGLAQRDQSRYFINRTG